MISVCIAVKNGEAYLMEQLASILQQLTDRDEIIISNDHSTDGTSELIRGYHDNRIRLFESAHRGVTANFENCLQQAKGDYIFLSDQDDIWLPGRVSSMLKHLQTHDLVVCDCSVTDESLRIIVPSFFEMNNSGRGMLKNLWRNSYMGCCMAFNRRVLSKALPFPKGLPVHDLWIGLTAEIFFTTRFVKETFLLHRRHAHNASTTGRRSNYSLTRQINYRLRVLNSLVQLKYV